MAGSALGVQPRRRRDFCSSDTTYPWTNGISKRSSSITVLPLKPRHPAAQTWGQVALRQFSPDCQRIAFLDGERIRVLDHRRRDRDRRPGRVSGRNVVAGLLTGWHNARRRDLRRPQRRRISNCSLWTQEQNCVAWSDTFRGSQRSRLPRTERNSCQPAPIKRFGFGTCPGTNNGQSCTGIFPRSIASPFHRTGTRSSVAAKTVRFWLGTRNTSNAETGSTRCQFRCRRLVFIPEIAEMLSCRPGRQCDPLGFRDTAAVGIAEFAWARE